MSPQTSPGRKAKEGGAIMDLTAIVIILVILYLIVREKSSNGRKGR